MSDEATNVADATESTAAEPAKPNTAALASLDGAMAKRGGGASPAATTSGAAAPAEGAKRKRKSGRHKSRAELAAIVKEYESGARTPGEKKPRAADPAAPSVPTPDAAPVVVGNPALKAKFAAGLSRALGAVSRMVARRRGVHWQFDSLDCDALGEAAADCLEAVEGMAPSLTPYIGKAIELAPFGVLAGVAYEVIDSRLEIDAEIASGKRSRVMPGKPETPSASSSLKAV